MIIRTSDGRFFWMTDHALEEMEDDNLTEYDIQIILEQGEKEESQSSGRDIYIHNGIAVVVDDNDNIRTVYRIS